MKSKKLLIILIVVAVVIATVVVLASVFTLSKTILVYHDFTGQKYSADILANDEITAMLRGQSTVFLHESDNLKKLNAKYTDWYFFELVRDFPNVVEVHCVRREAFFKFDLGGRTVYIDSFGYQVAEPTDNRRLIDVTSAFISPLVAAENSGEKFRFAENDENNRRLDCILESLMGLWECKVDIENYETVLGAHDVYTFDSEGTMIITLRVGAKICFMNPQDSLRTKFKKAFSVYFSPTYDLRRNGITITVWPDGKITTPEKDVTRI